MKNPPCICLDVFVEATLGRMDRATWMVEYEQHVLNGHVASCHHRSPKPTGILGGWAGPREHRAFAWILDDLMASQD